MTRQLSNVFSFLRDERGQDLMEYALLFGFVAAASVAVMPNIAQGVKVAFGRACAAIDGVAYVATPSPPADPIRIICAVLAVVILSFIVLRRRSQ